MFKLIISSLAIATVLLPSIAIIGVCSIYQKHYKSYGYTNTGDLRDCGYVVYYKGLAHEILIRQLGIEDLKSALPLSVELKKPLPSWSKWMRKSGQVGCLTRVEGVVGWPMPFVRYAYRRERDASGKWQGVISPGIKYASTNGVAFTYNIAQQEYLFNDPNLPNAVFPSEIVWSRMIASFGCTWIGTFIACACFLLVIAFIKAIRSAIWVSSAKCWKCGYDNSGITGGQCPECGSVTHMSR